LWADQDPPESQLRAVELEECGEGSASLREAEVGRDISPKKAFPLMQQTVLAGLIADILDTAANPRISARK
jgi:hypothetical protein